MNTNVVNLDQRIELFPIGYFNKQNARNANDFSFEKVAVATKKNRVSKRKSLSVIQILKSIPTVAYAIFGVVLFSILGAAEQSGGIMSINRIMTSTIQIFFLGVVYFLVKFCINDFKEIFGMLKD